MTKTKLNIKALIKRIVRVLAFVVLFLLAAYGLRQMFSVMQDTLNVAMTVGIILGLGYIIFLES